MRTNKKEEISNLSDLNQQAKSLNEGDRERLTNRIIQSCNPRRIQARLKQFDKFGDDALYYLPINVFLRSEPTDYGVNTLILLKRSKLRLVK